tara:strand:+ start:54 stop:410 length:357 start_codon:yes stop_codon:yes gene_type:complete
MNSKNTVAVILLTTLLYSCYKDKEDSLFGSVQCETTTVSFSADIMPILSTSCSTVGCHVQGGSGNGLFENYNQVKAKIDNGSFRQRVVVQKDMPPSAPLKDCQVKHIEQWILDGALNN